MKQGKSYLESISEEGVLTLATRLRRVADILFTQVQDLYSSNNRNFKPAWFPFLLALSNSKNLDIKTLAKKRKVTPSAASQIIKELIDNKLVSVELKTTDQRQKKIKITKKGLDALNSLIPDLKIIEKSLIDIIGDDQKILFEILENTESQLTKNSILERGL